MENQFIRNIPTLTEAEQALLQSKRVLVAGCGGLGNYIIEYLTRLGVGQIAAVDGDSFDETNLNRQLYATRQTMGQSKVSAARQRAALISPFTQINALCRSITAENAPALLAGHDVVVDALDQISPRLALEDACETLGIPIVHGAVEGWVYQVAVAEPGSAVLHRLYANRQTGGGKSVLSFVPAACAAAQTAETLKLLLGRPTLPSGKMLWVDMESASHMILSIG